MGNKSLKQNLKKNLAIATMAASLGVSLGVAVGDVLADDTRASSPPGFSRQDKDNASSAQFKSNQLKDSTQFKESTQIKESNQGKVDQKSNQTKVGYKVEPKSEPAKK